MCGKVLDTANCISSQRITPVFMGKYKFGQEIAMTTDNPRVMGKNVLLLYQSEQYG
jgi:hypothetical protein